MKVSACHEAKMFCHMIKPEFLPDLFQLFQPVGLLLAPLAGEEGKEYAMTDETLFIAVGRQQFKKPGWDLLYFKQCIKRPFNGFKPGFFH